MYIVVVLLSLFVGNGLCCSCVEGSFDVSRRSAICDGFGYSDNVFVAAVQEVYCKCLPLAGEDRAYIDPPTNFSCIKYTYENGQASGEVQETFSCNSTIRYAHYSYGLCNSVSTRIGISKWIEDYCIYMAQLQLSSAQIL